MNEKMIQQSEMFPEFRIEVDRLKELYGKLVEIALDSEELYNPAVIFKKNLQEKFDELEIREPLKDFGAYHYAIGSSPSEEQTKFDTEDGLILKTMEKFYIESVQ